MQSGLVDTVRDERTAARDEAVPLRMQLVRLIDCDRPLAPSGRHLLDGIDEVLIGRGPLAASRERGAVHRLHLRIDDPRMSGRHARLFRVDGCWMIEDAGSTNGTLVGGAAIACLPVGHGAVFEMGRTFFTLREAAVPLDAPADAVADDLRPPVPALATFVPSLQREYERLASVAPTRLPVLILGETGTGKELVARALHALSGRSGDLVALNCGALPESLVTSELFGHRRGAFSGALVDRPGLVRSAERGTLFLDEIGELPPGPQVAFLRVLQEQEVVPVGDSRPVAVDFRVVAATHRELAALVSSGAFRADLLGRLTGLVVVLPPLRERRDDLGLLVSALLRRLPRPERIRFDAAAVRTLIGHDWPLNVRELEKCLETAAALAPDGLIERRHLLATIGSPSWPSLPIVVSGSAPSLPRVAAPSAGHSALKTRLEELLATHDGNVAAVARTMGKGRKQIYRWARRFGIELRAFRAQEEAAGRGGTRSGSPR